MDNEKVLLISPLFFNYHKLIKNGLEELNYEVHWYSDRPSDSFITKSLLRLKKSLLNKKISNYLNWILKETDNINFEYVLIIFGECISIEFIKKLRKKYKQAKFIFYMWDSLSNFSHANKLSLYFDKCYSFDRDDCEKNKNFNFLPLFYTKKLMNNNLNLIYDFSFIGTIKKGKYSKIKMVIAEAKKNNLKIYLHMYLQGRLVYIYNKIFNYKEFKGSKMSDFKYKPLSYDIVETISGQSKAVLDIPMAGQKGLTIRTFETLAMSKKLITTNVDIKNYDFFDINNIFIFTDTLNLEFFETKFNDSKKWLLDGYELLNWLNYILKED